MKDFHKTYKVQFLHCGRGTATVNRPNGSGPGRIAQTEPDSLAWFVVLKKFADCMYCLVNYGGGVCVAKGWKF